MDSKLIIKKIFGQTCKFFREKNNLSQEKFSLSIGMDRTYYASVELGRRNISILNIVKICNGFNISMSDFFSVYEQLSKGDSNARV